MKILNEIMITKNFIKKFLGYPSVLQRDMRMRGSANSPQLSFFKYLISPEIENPFFL